jgi:3-oxoacyl-[acyl-carrier protein] reductase
LGSPDILVNGAGSVEWREPTQLTDADWQMAWELNVMAPMRLMEAMAPEMADRGWGRIVNIASSASKRPLPQIAEYSVTKAAMLSLSRVYADRFAAHGVLINALCPGPARSDMWMRPGGQLDQVVATGDFDGREEAIEAISGSRPIGRFAEPTEIADVIVFLASDRASYVSGVAWSVDGGTVQVII